MQRASLALWAAAAPPVATSAAARARRVTVMLDAPWFIVGRGGKALRLRHGSARSRNRLGAQIAEHVRDVIGLADVDALFPQDRVGGHDVEVELAERPVPGELFFGEVEGQAHFEV